MKISSSAKLWVFTPDMNKDTTPIHVQTGHTHYYADCHNLKRSQLFGGKARRFHLMVYSNLSHKFHLNTEILSKKMDPFFVLPIKCTDLFKIPYLLLVVLLRRLEQSNGVYGPWADQRGNEGARVHFLL